jgi:hypothetical protein
MNFIPISERLRILRVKGRFFNYSLINIHGIPRSRMLAMMWPRTYSMKNLSRRSAPVPGNDMKIVMRDANTKIGRETIHHPMIGKYSLHETTNENGLRLIDFPAADK